MTDIIIVPVVSVLVEEGSRGLILSCLLQLLAASVELHGVLRLLLVQSIVAKDVKVVLLGLVWQHLLLLVELLVAASEVLEGSHEQLVLHVVAVGLLSHHRIQIGLTLLILIITSLHVIIRIFLHKVIFASVLATHIASWLLVVAIRRLNEVL